MATPLNPRLAHLEVVIRSRHQADARHWDFRRLTTEDKLRFDAILARVAGIADQRARLAVLTDEERDFMAGLAERIDET